jgi:hypothetical protein
MQMDKRSLCCLVVLAISTILQGERGQSSSLKQALISQSEPTIRLSANAPRPLEQALDTLQQEYGWQVDYEDPQYVSELDVVEVPDPKFPASHSESRTRVPGGAAFHVQFVIGPKASLDEEKTLGAVIDSYNQSNNPGQFELRKIAERDFDIVGISAHDKQGRLSPQRALLDLPIIVPVVRRSASDTVALICKTLAARSHTSVNLGVYPRHLLDYRMVRVGGSAIPARTLLINTLASPGRNFYWRMLFDPDSRTYFLNLHSVRNP